MPFKWYDPNDPMKPIAAKNPNGWSIAADVSGVTVEHDTKMCPHCNEHFNFVAGSGRIRGWCPLCNGVTCGAPRCNSHFPFEKRMDYFEKGRLEDLLGPVDSILPEHKRIIMP